MRRRLLALTATLTLALAGCAPTYTSAGIGRYDVFRPFAKLDGRAIELELERAAYVAVVNVVPPSPSFRDRPILFEAVYPYYPSDQRRFEAGRHRLIPRRETVREPMGCGMEEIPTIDGCRRRFDMLPGVNMEAGRAYPRSYSIRAGHYIALVADRPIDPYTLAEELYYLAFERPELSRVLREMNADLAAAELERALLDRPGTPNWAAIYVAAR